MAKIKKAMGGYSTMKHGGMHKKAKSGSSFGMLSVKAGIDKNPNPTYADKIAGAKKQAKGGAKLKKQAATAIAMKAAGKKPKKARGGATLSPSKKSVSSNLGGYKRTIGKSMRNGGKMNMGGKCRGGCY